MRLAKESNVTAPRLSVYLKGKQTPTLEVVERIAAALGCQPWELLKPDGAQAAPAPKEPGNEELLAAMQKQRATIVELQEKVRKLEAQLLPAGQGKNLSAESENERLRREVDASLVRHEKASSRKKTKA